MFVKLTSSFIGVKGKQNDWIIYESTYVACKDTSLVRRSISMRGYETLMDEIWMLNSFFFSSELWKLAFDKKKVQQDRRIPKEKLRDVVNSNK